MCHLKMYVCGISLSFSGYYLYKAFENLRSAGIRAERNLSFWSSPARPLPPLSNRPESEVVRSLSPGQRSQHGHGRPGPACPLGPCSQADHANESKSLTV